MLMLDFVTQDPAQSRAGRDMLGIVADILDRIVNRPDDAACRKLRLTHPALMVSHAW